MAVPVGEAIDEDAGAWTEDAAGAEYAGIETAGADTEEYAGTE